MSLLYLVLRIHERFGRSPFGDAGWWDCLAPGEQAALIANERIRQAEEARASAPPVKP